MGLGMEDSGTGLLTPRSKKIAGLSLFLHAILNILYFSEFLEDMYPEKVRLFPKDPFEKHRQRMLVEVLGNKVSA